MQLYPVIEEGLYYIDLELINTLFGRIINSDDVIATLYRFDLNAYINMNNHYIFNLSSLTIFVPLYSTIVNIVNEYR